MSPSRREALAFSVVLAALVAGFLSDSLMGGLVLSPGDVAYADPAFSDLRGPGYEPENRLLMDPALQFEPWMEFCRDSIRHGHLPLWNPYAGCGTPMLANGQSAVFDPFHAIAYLGPWPESLAWMAAARLWVAGMGMFWLAPMWNYGPWGRWFCGLAYPFCGFLVVWLLYPVTSVAVWLPWLLAAVESTARRPSAGSCAGLAAAVGAVLLGGHVQTSAHVLIAASIYAGWRWRAMERGAGRVLTVGLLLGIGLAAVEVVPLAGYLARSPVWTDRREGLEGFWAPERPRILDSACTAFPYLYGSQRKGHPNLAKPLGVHNLNESAGGFSGLATLIWLAPLGVLGWKERPIARFLSGLAVLGALGAFSVPPVPNLLGLVPVLNVIDHRRLTLWVAFGVVGLGGLGMDRLGCVGLGARWVFWERCWRGAALAMMAAAVAVPLVVPVIEPRVKAHYQKVGEGESARYEPVAEALADRQLRNFQTFMPLYLGLGAVHLLALASLSAMVRGGRVAPGRIRGCLLALVLIDLFAFGRGLNPAIKSVDRAPESIVITRLKEVAPFPSRILPIGDVLPPNRLMSYGLCDVRNYDSVELSRSLDWFAPLYEAEPGPHARHSRRSISWEGVIRSIDRLRIAGVSVVVGPSAPGTSSVAGLCEAGSRFENRIPRSQPPATESDSGVTETGYRRGHSEGPFERVERVGRVWLAFLGPATSRVVPVEDGRISVAVSPDEPRPVRLAVTNDPGWTVEIDGRPSGLGTGDSPFLEVVVPPGPHRLTMRYEPGEVRVAIWITIASAVAWGALFSVSRIGGLLAKKPSKGLEPPWRSR